MFKLVGLLMLLLSVKVLMQDLRINDDLIPNVSVRFLNIANKSIFELGQNETIDIQGNLTINEYSVEDLSKSNLTRNDTFEVDFQDKPQIEVVIVNENFTLESNIFSLFECFQNSDCNKGQSTGPNICLKIKSFKNFNLNSTSEMEFLLRNIEFISNKEKFSLIKYNQLLDQSSEFVTQLLVQYNTTYEILLSGGVCICDEKYFGYRCENQVVNEKLNLCHVNSQVQTCYSGVCKIANFKLKNTLNANKNLYKSYKCECDQNQIGLNCEYNSNKCSSRKNSTFIQNDDRLVCSNSSLFCYPLTNDKFNCANKIAKLNYLIFDDRNLTLNNDVRLDLFKPEVLNQIQDFIKNYAFNSYLTNDYSKTPKGPLAILLQQIDTIFTPIKNKFNQLISQNSTELNRLINNRIRNLIKEIETNTTNIDYILSKLQIFDTKNYTDYQAIQSNLESTSNLNSSLFQLDLNLNKLNTSSNLTIFKIDNQFYINITNKTYNIIRLDILSGIYVTSNEKLTIRPTPGLFLTSINNNSELVFLPGLFNPYSNECTDLSCIFTFGVMSFPVDTYDIDSYMDESTKYLNKFTSLILPYNINGILVPFKSLNITYLNSTNITASSKLILTPLDFNQNNNFDFIKRDSDFIGDVFTFESFSKLIQSIDQSNLAQTQIRFQNENNKIRLRENLDTINPKGIQFYNLIQPNNDIKVISYLIYGTNELDTISNEVIQNAIETYCSNYKLEMNELHSRICEAQKRTTILLDEFKNDPDYCASQNDCSFSDYILDYYKSTDTESSTAYSLIIKKTDSASYVAILVLAAILTVLWLLLVLFLCCCFLSFCPLAKWRSRKSGSIISTKIKDSKQINSTLKINDDDLNHSIKSCKIYSSNNNDVYYSTSTATFQKVKDGMPSAPYPPPLSTLPVTQQQQQNTTELIESKNDSSFYLKRVSQPSLTPRSSNASNEISKNFFSYVPSATANYFYLKSEKPANLFYINPSESYEKIQETDKNPQAKITDMISTISSSLTKSDLVTAKINEINDQTNTAKCCSCNKNLNDLFQFDFHANDDNNDDIFICDICDYSWNSGSFVYNNFEFVSTDEKDAIRSK